MAYSEETKFKHMKLSVSYINKGDYDPSISISPVARSQSATTMNSTVLDD